MYRIELYGVGYKNGNSIQAIVGICYISRVDSKQVVKDNILERKNLQKGRIMDMATIDNTLITGSTTNLLSSTLDTRFGKTTIFGIKFSDVVTNTKKNDFVKYIKRFPTTIIAFIK